MGSEISSCMHLIDSALRNWNDQKSSENTIWMKQQNFIGSIQDWLTVCLEHHLWLDCTHLRFISQYWEWKEIKWTYTTKSNCCHWFKWLTIMFFYGNLGIDYIMIICMGSMHITTMLVGMNRKYIIWQTEQWYDYRWFYKWKNRMEWAFSSLFFTAREGAQISRFAVFLGNISCGEPNLSAGNIDHNTLKGKK